MSTIPNLRTYLEYNNQLAIIYRSGREDDPFVPRTNSLPVINNLITLLEVPSEAHGVQIAGFTEITKDKYNRTLFIGESEFLVNYSIGNIQFNPIHDGKTFTCSFMSRGLIMYPASRIYTLARENPDIVVTLQDYIDSLNNYQSTLNLKLEEINNAITRSIETTNDANAAIDNAYVAINNAEQATDAAYEAAATTIVYRKEAVDTYEDLLTTYPSPQNGWQVILNTNGDIYRYDGVYTNKWERVGNVIGGLPTVSEFTDGLLKKEDYKKFVIRTLFFTIPKVLSQGIQPTGYNILPFDGEIIKAEAYCSGGGLSVQTEISIDRISKEDLLAEKNWDNIFSQNLIFPPRNIIANGGVIADNWAKEGDIFRINVSQFDNSIKGITVKLDIKTTYIEEEQENA